MTSAFEGGGGRVNQNQTTVRKVAWIWTMDQAQMWTGEREGSKPYLGKITFSKIKIKDQDLFSDFDQIF